MRKIYLSAVVIALLLSGCGGQIERSVGEPMVENGMSSRHHAEVPDVFAGLTSPSLSKAEIDKGGELYTKLCVSCHGDGGMGDGPAAASLDPAPAPVAHTSTMLSDSYLYWRIAEGGSMFQSTMPAWKSTLKDDEIWALIGYLRALGSGQAVPEQVMSGEAYNPSTEDAIHEEMLTKAVELDLITEDEANTFLLVHNAMDQFRTAHQEDLPQDNMDEAQSAILTELVNEETITQSQADDFARIHQLLIDEGLMD
jgi:mono/diheme cytochrome c family protein